MVLLLLGRWIQEPNAISCGSAKPTVEMVCTCSGGFDATSLVRCALAAYLISK